MSLLIKHFGFIKNGRKVYHNPELYNAQLLQLEGQEFEEIIKKRTRKTTHSQFDFYRGIILPICYQQECFSHYDKPDDIHDDYFADKFLSYTKTVTLPDGRKVEKKRTISTSSLTVEEMSKFIEKVIIDCAELGIIIKDPQAYINSHYK